MRCKCNTYTAKLRAFSNLKPSYLSIVHFVISMQLATKDDIWRNFNLQGRNSHSSQWQHENIIRNSASSHQSWQADGKIKVWDFKYMHYTASCCAISSKSKGIPMPIAVNIKVQSYINNTFKAENEKH